MNNHDRMIKKLIVDSSKVSCDGGHDNKHPKVYLELVPDADTMKCPYCSQIFLYKNKLNQDNSSKSFNN